MEKSMVKNQHSKGGDLLVAGLISTCFPCKTVADSYWKPIYGSICCCFFPFLRGIRSLVYDNSLTRF